jgi:hypothetical protein
MHKLLAELSPERFAALYASLDEPVARALDGSIARMLNCRPQSVRRQPAAMRAKALRAWILKQRDETVAGDLLRAYLLGPCKELVTQFLDATGVSHEDGQVADDSSPDAQKIPGAVEALLGAHERDDVALYLKVAALQWPDEAALRTALESLETPA